MKINEINIENKEDLRDVYIHDTYITNINIDYDNKKIIIDFSESEKRCYTIIFENIARFELYKLSLWGITHNQILDMYLDDYDIKQYINQKGNYKYKTTQNLDNLFTIEILAENGDKISITCERVICIDLSKEQQD